MKFTLPIKGSFLASLIISASLPAFADSVGTDYLMTHSLLDPQELASRNQTTAKGKPRSLAQAQTTNTTPEPAANTEELPTQILKTGVSLTTSGLSANSRQLSDDLGLTKVLERITELRSRAGLSNDQTLAGLSAKQDLLEATQSARLIIQKASLEVDYTVAEIYAEQEVYKEILDTFKSDRDKALALTNAFAFISNGVLWAVTEALVIPTYKLAIYNIPAGIVGIPAGLVPSIASMYTFKLANGKKKTSEVEPNMLAKLFNYPTSPEIEYPNSVWTFLNEVPAESPGGKKRLDQMVNRWIEDANMPAFTDKNSKKQLDVITASVEQRKALTIAILTARSIMLDQLLTEVNKMQRMLLELNMVAVGNKHFVANSG